MSDYIQWGFLLTPLLMFASWYYFMIIRGNKPGLNIHDAKNPYLKNSFPGDTHRVELTHGVTQYYIAGHESGKKILLIHEIAPAVVLRDLTKQLIANGFQVLCYDIYGRGFSDSPDIKYGKNLYISQIYELCKKVGWEKMGIIGFSLGGTIASSFANSYPSMITHIALFAPYGLYDKIPILSKIPLLPFIGEIFLFTIIKKRLLSSSPRFFIDKNSSIAKKVVEIYKYQIKNHPGYLRAYFSTLRNFSSGLQSEFKQLSNLTHCKVLVIWGDSDNVVPFKHSHILKRLIPRAQIVTVTGAGNFLICEDPFKVYPSIMEFFSM